MQRLTLHFVAREQLTRLLEDDEFRTRIDYLEPVRVDENYLQLEDPVETHQEMDSEVVILSIFARGIKRLLYPDTNQNITFLNPDANGYKRGLMHDRLVIIDSVRIERHDIPR